MALQRATPFRTLATFSNRAMSRGSISDSREVRAWDASVSAASTDASSCSSVFFLGIHFLLLRREGRFRLCDVRCDDVGLHHPFEHLFFHRPQVLLGGRGLVLDGLVFAGWS